MPWQVTSFSDLSLEESVKELQRKRHSATPGVSFAGRVRKVAKWEAESEEEEEESEWQSESNYNILCDSVKSTVIYVTLIPTLHNFDIFVVAKNNFCVCTLPIHLIFS